MTSRRHLSRRGRVRKRYILLLMVLLAIGWVGWKVYAIMSARPGPLIDYTPQLIALSEKYQPEGENGWPALMKALEHFDNIGVPDVEGWPSEDQRLLEVVQFWQMSVGTFDRERLRFELAYLWHIRQSGVLDEIDAALDAPRFVRMEYSDPSKPLRDTEYPELGRSRRLAMALCAGMRKAAETSTDAELLDSWTRLMRLAHAISCTPLLFHRHTADSIEWMAAFSLAEILTEHEIDEVTCGRMLAVLPADGNLAPLEAAIQGERFGMLDLINRTHSRTGLGGGQLLPERVEALTYVDRWSRQQDSAWDGPTNAAGLQYAKRDEIEEIYNRYMDSVIAEVRKPRAEQSRERISAQTFRNCLTDRHVFLQDFPPSTLGLFGQWYRQQSMYHAIRILLALEAYEARQSALPDSLDALVPEYLPGLPIDATSNQGYAYVRRRPTPDDPRRSWLYSVCDDQVDDHGKELGESPWAALNSSSTQGSFDYIFNRLREPVEEER